jgi:hypothetical protein
MEKKSTLDKLLKQTGETLTLEFKRAITLSSDADKYEFAKDVSAFGNTKGGCILYGKEDMRQGGRIVGIDPNTFDADQMQQIITSRCYPPVEFTANIIKKRSKFFAIVQIPESSLKPHEIVSTREVWIRRGGTTDRATQTEREQLPLRRDALQSPRALSPKERIEKEGIPEEPEGLARKTIIRAGRAYMRRVHGRLDISLLKEELILLALALLCFVPVTYWFYEIMSMRTTSVQLYSVFSVFLAFFGVFLLYGLKVVESLKCPECRRHFGVRRIQHTRVKDREIDRTEDSIKREVTYSNEYACEFCDHKEQKIETETETIDL